MISVAIEYKPFGFLWRRRIEAKLPEHWKEMTSEQLASVQGLQDGSIDEPKLLQIFLGLKHSIARRVDSYQRYCILRNLKHIAQPEPVSFFITKKILCFKAPEDKLKGITFAAFIFGDTYYQNYISGKEEDLDRFIACYFYNKLGFQEKDVETNARLIRLTDIKVRRAIAINYALIREWLAMSYPYVFQKADENVKKDTSGWVAVFDAVVGDDIVNQERYAEKPLSSMLRYLNRKIKNHIKNGGKV